VSVVGQVPDLKPLLRRARVAVSPTRFGTGIKVKVAEAMAAGLPVVGTSTGLSGFKQASCLLRADDARTFADAVVRLLQDDAYRKRVGNDCYQFYRDHFWIESARPSVLELYRTMIESTAAQDATPAATADAR
jgi:glycosyltransferase involved in cell wall biosynthesis